MRRIFPLVFALSLVTRPVLAWSWGGDGNCPNSKDKLNQEKTEKVEELNK